MSAYHCVLQTLCILVGTFKLVTESVPNSISMPNYLLVVQERTVNVVTAACSIDVNDQLTFLLARFAMEEQTVNVNSQC